MTEHNLEVLKEQMPELFQERELALGWDEIFIIEPVPDVERRHHDEYTELAHHPVGHSPTAKPFDELGPWLVQEEGEGWPEIDPRIVQVLGGAHPGAPLPADPAEPVPPTDSLAFYLPYHYYYPRWWGVYLLAEGVLSLARYLHRQQNVPPLLAWDGARMFLYFHEAFHNRTECFATRLELTHRRPLYKTGFEQFYRSTLGTDECLEEGLANAKALQDVWLRLKNQRVIEGLVAFTKLQPPGYRRAAQIRADYNAVRCAWAEKKSESVLSPTPGAPSRHLELCAALVQRYHKYQKPGELHHPV